jgi:hypothetical protein
LIPQPKEFITFLWNDNSINDSLLVIGKKAGIGEHKYWVEVTDNNYCSNSDTINITVVSAVDIEFENREHTTISLYPNPTTGILNLQIKGIEYGDLILEVVSMEGRKIMIRQYKNSETIVTDELNISQMPAGPYIIRVIYKDTEMLTTIIKI